MQFGMKSLAIIVIIAHKKVLSKNEEMSLLQCCKVFEKYPIRLVCPEGLDVSVYQRLIPGAKIDFIDPKWQSDYKMFSLLKVDKLLYKKYERFQYLLFYEVDAWVFNDELEYWCNKQFDYIGAPWFEGHEKGNSTKIIGAGNGGFSLRNTRASIRMARRLKFLKQLRLFWYKSYLQSIVRFNTVTSLFKHWLRITDAKKLDDLLLEKEVLEDRYWAEGIGNVFTDFKVAPVKDAIKFSFEMQPLLLYKMNNETLPFGCHAWGKYEPWFWRKFIPMTEEINA
jgi:hypothetical protein